MEEDSRTPLVKTWGQNEIGNDALKNAQSFARSAEDGANSAESSEDARSLEQSPSSTPTGSFRYTGSGTKNNLKNNTNSTPKGSQSVKNKSKIKKYAPLAILVAIIAGGGIIIGFIQSMAPFSFLENAKNMFNTTRTSYNISSNTLTDTYLENDSTADTSNTYGSLEFSDEMQKQLRSAGIEYTVAGGVKGLLYQSPSSKEWMFVTSNSTNAGNLVGQTISTSSGSSAIISKVETLNDAYTTDTKFANALDTGLRSWKGHSAGWYNSTGEIYNAQIGNTRDKFYEFGQVTPSYEEYADAIKSNGAEVKVDGSSSSAKYADGCSTHENEDGESETTCSNSYNSGSGELKQGMDDNSVKRALTDRAKNAMLAGEKEATNECKVAKAVAATSAAATGVLKIQTMNSGSAFLEAADKAKVGDGGGAINAQMRKLSTPGETLTLNDNADWEPIEGKENATAVGSLAWDYVAGGGPALSSDDRLVKTFTLESMITNSTISNRLKDATDYSDNAVAKCSSTTNYSDAGTFYNDEGSGPVGGLFSVIGNLFKEIIRFFTGDNTAKYINEQSNNIAEVEAKRTKAYLDMDIENMSGETPAYAITSGAEAYYQQMQIMISARPGTEAELQAYWKDTQNVIAREAEIDREILSPFDTTSQNTFLGSLIAKASPVMSKVSTPLKAFSNFLGTTISSIQSIIPIAGAASAENGYKQSIRNDCQTYKYLEAQSGTMAGNAFCFQKAYQDTSTAKTSLRNIYNSILYGVSESFRGIENFKGVDSDGTPKVNPQGEYATWLVACSVRKSQWGYLNGQAASFIQEQFKGSGASTTTKGALEEGLESQKIDEITDLTTYDRDALDWATGLNCMGGRNGSLSRQVANYAQFNTYQNLLEIAGSTKQTSQVAFLTDYYDSHPYYNTFEGIIAQYSGLTPEDTELALGLVDYYDYIAHYEPLNLGPAAPVPEATPIYFEDTAIIAQVLPDAPLPTETTYADLRTRTLII